MPVTCGDLFCGAGGFTEGMRQAGINVLFGIDNEKSAVLTYVINQPGTWGILGDIRKIPLELIHALCPDQRINMVIGGPPCQGYSKSNLRKKTDDLRNTLWKEYLRFVAGLKPDYFIMENVPELLKMKDQKGGLIIDAIYRTAKVSGYKIEHKILNAADYGVPQIRKRIIIIGSSGKPIEWPEQTHFNPKLLSPAELTCTKEKEQEGEGIDVSGLDDGVLISNILGVGCIIVGDRIGNLECTFSTNPDMGMAMRIPPEGSYAGSWEWVGKMLELCMDMGEIAAINPLIGRYYSFTYS